VKTNFEMSFFGRKKQFTIGEGHVTRSAKKKLKRAAAATKRKVKKTVKKTVRR
jgi:hypothetical protein